MNFDIRKKILALIILLFFLISTAFANGGPGDSSAITETGNISLVKKNNISIEKEYLSLEIEDDYVRVHVLYQLKNKGSSDNITYVFPVDYYGDEFSGISYGAVKNFTIKDKDKILDIRSKIIDNVPMDVISQYDKYSEVAPEKLVRKWYVTDVDFKADEEKELSVDYTIKTAYLDWSISGVFGETYGNRTFVYDLTPAGNWGNGTVKSFELRLDAVSLYNDGGKLVKTNIENMSEKNHVYSYKATDFDLSKQKNIIFTYDNSTEYNTGYLEYYKIDKSWIKSITSSSAAGSGYTVSALMDGNFDTAWVEGAGGYGLGEWLDIRFVKGVQIGSICLANGYLKSKEVFENNSRIKKVRVEEYYKDKLISSGSIDVADKKYEQFNKRFYGDSIDSISGKEYTDVDRIKITILDVYKGRKYADTCISELFIFLNDEAY